MNGKPVRWLQFNLATLFLATALIGVGLVWPAVWRAGGFALAALCAWIALSRLRKRNRKVEQPDARCDLLAHGAHVRKCRTDHGRAFALAIAVLLLPCVYVGGYVALMAPRTGLGQGQDGVVWRQRNPEYRWGGTLSELIFAPLAALDRRFRPDYWRQRREPSACLAPQHAVRLVHVSL